MANTTVKPQMLGDNAPINLYFNGMTPNGNTYFQTQLSRAWGMSHNDFYFNADENKMYEWGARGNWIEFKRKYTIVKNNETK